MNKGQSFTWINIYKELAKKLLEYRNNRKAILDFIYSNREEFMANYLRDSDDKDDLCKDIDPFTVFGLFNRTISDKKRINTIKKFKKFFSLSSDVLSFSVITKQFGMRAKTHQLYHLIDAIKLSTLSILTMPASSPLSASLIAESVVSFGISTSNLSIIQTISFFILQKYTF